MSRFMDDGQKCTERVGAGVDHAAAVVVVAMAATIVKMLDRLCRRHHIHFIAKIRGYKEEEEQEQ